MAHSREQSPDAIERDLQAIAVGWEIGKRKGAKGLHARAQDPVGRHEGRVDLLIAAGCMRGI